MEKSLKTKSKKLDDIVFDENVQHTKSHRYDDYTYLGFGIRGGHSNPPINIHYSPEFEPGDAVMYWDDDNGTCDGVIESYKKDEHSEFVYFIRNSVTHKLQEISETCVWEAPDPF